MLKFVAWYTMLCDTLEQSVWASSGTPCMLTNFSHECSTFKLSKGNHKGTHKILELFIQHT